MTTDSKLFRQIAAKLQASPSGALSPQGSAPVRSAAKAAIGFDGFIDSVVRVTRGHGADGRPVHFATKREFADRIIALEEANSSFELTEIITKIGGNAPNTAHALGRLGIDVDCIGMFGLPQPHCMFDDMAANCTLHSYAEPTASTALEFEDGKLLLAGSAQLRSADWSTICAAIDLDRLIAIFGRSDIVGFANWGELDHASDIWEGVERDVLSRLPAASRRIVFFDLADPTRRASDLGRVLALVARLTDQHETVLSLNRNEALAIANFLSIPPATRLEDLGPAIYAALEVHTLLLRDPHVALAWTPDGPARAATFHLDHPRVSTGGGDNFNAGYAFARHLGCDPLEGLVVASAVAGLYVATGESPSAAELLDFLNRQIDRDAPVHHAEAV